MEKACVQIYTGDGKGKTSAAIGLSVRAAGRGLSVKFVQFLKGRDTGELSVLRRISGIEIVRAASCTRFFYQLSAAQKEALREDVLRTLALVNSWLGSADVIVLDESLGAIACGILTVKEALHIIEAHGSTEVIFTGRDAPEEMIEKAQLVTRMCAVKHYYDTGLSARCGIEF